MNAAGIPIAFHCFCCSRHGLPVEADDGLTYTPIHCACCRYMDTTPSVPAPAEYLDLALRGAMLPHPSEWPSHADCAGYSPMPGVWGGLQREDYPECQDDDESDTNSGSGSGSNASTLRENVTGLPRWELWTQDGPFDVH